jgi:thiosulfate reductase cytochrome b subunit
MTKKRYNPFKMFGSYLGAVIGAVLFLIVGIGIHTSKLSAIVDVMIKHQTTIVSNLFIVFCLVAGFIVGFLTGWGIHSLFRLNKGGRNSSRT